MFNPPPCRQEIYFNDGSIRVIEAVKIEQGRWFHLKDKNGTEFIINPDKVLFVKVNKI